MKKSLAAILFSLSAAACSAQLVTGYAAVLSGPRWTITNVSVGSSDRFYVGLNSTSVNYMALDLLVNAANLTRFNAYGDYGTRTGGTGVGYFVGYGYTQGSTLHLNLRDALNSVWDCYLNANMTGDCAVYTNLSRPIGSVRLTWNP